MCVSCSLIGLCIKKLQWFAFRMHKIRLCKIIVDNWQEQRYIIQHYCRQEKTAYEDFEVLKMTYGNATLSRVKNNCSKSKMVEKHGRKKDAVKNFELETGWKKGVSLKNFISRKLTREVPKIFDFQWFKTSFSCHIENYTKFQSLFRWYWLDWQAIGNITSTNSFSVNYWEIRQLNDFDYRYHDSSKLLIVIHHYH